LILIAAPSSNYWIIFTRWLKKLDAKKKYFQNWSCGLLKQRDQSFVKYATEGSLFGLFDFSLIALLQHFAFSFLTRENDQTIIR
jgi:hypothetical protein